ncbi:hypothetical protein M9458_053391 [Cirrhinus mrigala]|uniref:Uncharacterized protein n=1 Tax=Cirrhinus mrigala TaxID=683832 RepID=A0ABD0MQD4_CIRMR
MAHCFLIPDKYVKWHELEPEYREKSFFLDDLPKISEESNKELECSLTLGELYKALQDMEWASSGLPESPVAGDRSDSLLKGGLPLSCRRMVITLLPKKGDLTEIKNWRPVSLLCSDYKLLSKTLANRLTKTKKKLLTESNTVIYGMF